MSSQIDLTEGAPPKNSTDTVELRGGDWRLIEFFEVELDYLLQLGKVFGVWTHVWIGWQRLVAAADAIGS